MDLPCSSGQSLSQPPSEAKPSESRLTFRRCAFCSIEQRELYKCPRCHKEYCNLRCYKSQQHSECSESFYKECVKSELEGRKYMGDKGAETFEEHMKKYVEGEEEHPPGFEKSNTPEDAEGELIDSDDEPEEDYLKKVIEGTMDGYGQDEDELERQLIGMGLGSDVQQLLDSLTEEERRAFAQLAEEVHINSTGLAESCFQRGSK